MYLIDTNVVSEIRKRSKANKGVVAFFRQAAQDDAGLYLSVVTVGELRRGIDLTRNRGDKAQAVRLEGWLSGVLREFGNHVLAVDEEISQVWGRLRVPNHDHDLDNLIAATALIHDLTVVTRNVDDFVGTGVRLLNPFD
jgi:predicted nucleic acid-binding protein